jgi:hypothetical protein
MPPAPNKTIGLSDLIDRVKMELLSEKRIDQPKLFSIDELTIEVNFVVNGDLESGFNLGVVTLESQVSEERVQKVTIKMTPLMSKQQLINNTFNGDQEKAKQTVQASSKAILRGDQ